MNRAAIFGRYIYTNTTSLQRFIAPVAFNRAQSQPNHNVAFNITHNIGANAVLDWWWADPLAALGIAAVAVREGVENWRGEGCADGCC